MAGTLTWVKLNDKRGEGSLLILGGLSVEGGQSRLTKKHSGGDLYFPEVRAATKGEKILDHHQR